MAPLLRDSGTDALQSAFFSTADGGTCIGCSAGQSAIGIVACSLDRVGDGTKAQGVANSADAVRDLVTLATELGNRRANALESALLSAADRGTCVGCSAGQCAIGVVACSLDRVGHCTDAQGIANSADAVRDFVTLAAELRTGWWWGRW